MNSEFRYVDNKNDLRNFIQEEAKITNSCKDISMDTKFICHWLYIIVKTMVAIFLKG